MFQQTQIVRTRKGYIHRADGPKPGRPKPTKHDIAQMNDLINHCLRAEMSNEEIISIAQDLDMMIFGEKTLKKRISELRDMHNGINVEKYRSIPTDKIPEVDALIRQGISENKTGKEIMEIMDKKKLNFLSKAGNYWRINKIREKMADEALAKEAGNANW